MLRTGNVGENLIQLPFFVFNTNSIHGSALVLVFSSFELIPTHLSAVPPDSVVMTGSYNNFFRMFDRGQRRDVTLEASRENSKPMQVLKPRKVCAGGKRKKDEISVDSLDFNKKILHTAWHPQDNIIAVATTNNLYIFQDKVN